MQKLKNLSLILSGVVIGGMVLAGGFAFAGDDTDALGKADSKPGYGFRMDGRGGMRGGHKGGFGLGGMMLAQDSLDKLVGAKVITEAKAAEIKTYIDTQENSANRGSKPGMLADLVTNKILTQEQADAIQSKLAEFAQQEKEQKLTDSLKTFVDKGTITQAQANQIKAKFEAMEKEQQAVREKMLDMTAEERKAYIEENPVKQVDPMSALVEAGVLTEGQASVIKELTPFGRGHRGGMFKNNLNQIKSDTTNQTTGTQS